MTVFTSILNKNNKKIYTIMNKIYVIHGHIIKIGLLSITREIKKENRYQRFSGNSLPIKELNKLEKHKRLSFKINLKITHISILVK
jgi:hypothetical protein